MIMAYGEQLYKQETFEFDEHPALFTEELLAKLALGDTVELN